MDEIAIKVQNISKTYKLYDQPMDRLKESLHPLRKKYHKDFYAVKDVNFEVKKGETVGIIGKNGSGKSTLLKMITGVLTPTTGSIQANGKISALLELGAGFNPEYTGMENVYLNGTIMGYTKEEMDEKVQSIIDFADIGEFIYQPVKTYSSGMFVRLAFAVAINVDPEILIVDEALSVGDMRFQQKCYRKIEELKKNTTILFVSHDLNALNKFCDRVLWLNEGILECDNSVEVVSKLYRAYMTDTKSFTNYMLADREFETSNTSEDFIDLTKIEDLEIMGDKKALITGIKLIDGTANKIVDTIDGNKEVILLLQCVFLEELYEIIVGFTIKDRLGNIVAQTNNCALNNKINTVNNKILCGFKFALPSLNRGKYSISPAIATGTQEFHILHCWIHDALFFDVVTNNNELEGFLILDNIDFSYGGF